MSKFGKKISAILLAAAVAVSAVSPAFAAGSPVSGKTGSDTKITAETTGKNTVEVTKVTSTGKNATIPATIKSDGKTYKVTEIAKGAINKKFDKVTVVMTNKTKVSANVLGKNGKKSGKIVIKKSGDKKLKASQFDQKSFKGYKKKIVVEKNVMTKKEFDKLAKKLKKGGFKGKISRKK